MPARPPDGRDGWPAWATEPVEVHDPDPSWQRRGARLCAELDALLAPWLAAPVEHVGSTAVPGLAAKPVLDLQAAVAELTGARPVTAALAAAGWEHVPPQLDERPWRLLFVLAPAGRRAAHLHVLQADSAQRQAQRAFRDALWGDPALAQRYAELKRSLADRYAEDREAYTEAKTAFVRSVLAQRG